MEKEILKNDDLENKNKHLGLKILFIVVVIGVFSLLWARYISTSGLIVKEYAIRNNKLSDDYDGFKIVHFSDLHYGSTIFKDELKNVVDTINNQNPNIVVFTGFNRKWCYVIR